MNELNEVRFGNDFIALKDNLVKTSILPKNSKELDREINFQENVVTEGAVYAKKIEIDNGPVEFKGAVFASTELHMKNDAKKSIIFRKAVGSADSIICLLMTGRAIFGADISSPNVKLKNCFVAGSIFGTEIHLENTVVLGGVFASKSLSMNNCIAGTFHAPQVDVGGINNLLYPTAFSVEPLNVIPGSELYSIALADLGSLFKNETEKENMGKIRIDISSDTQRTVLLDNDGSTILINSYSVADRVLVADMVDFEKMENHFLITAASLGSQILKNYTLQKQNGEKSDELTLENISSFFFKILSGEIQIRNLEGNISFDDLKKVFS